MSNLFSDIWGGWVGFWKEVGGKPVAQKVEKPKITAPVKNDKIKPVKKKPIKKPQTRPPKAAEDKEAEEEMVEPAPFPKVQEQHLETPAERMVRMQKKAQKRTDHRTKLRRQMLWMNPGTENLRLAHAAFLKGLSLPSWVVPLQGAMTFDDDRLFFEGLPMLNKEEKRELIKKEYFNPKGFSRQHPPRVEII